MNWPVVVLLVLLVDSVHRDFGFCMLFVRLLRLADSAVQAFPTEKLRVFGFRLHNRFRPAF